MKAIISKLMELGLSEYEAKGYKGGLLLSLI